MTGLIFEAMVAVALVFAATLCWRLDRRLTALKNGQDGVRAAVAELSAATMRAEASVRELRATSEETGRDLERRIALARGVADELHLLAGDSGRRRAAPDVQDEPASRTRRRAPRRAPAEPETSGEAARSEREMGRTLGRDPLEAAETAERLARLRGVR